jgi:hypothetical protein
LPVPSQFGQLLPDEDTPERLQDLQAWVSSTVTSFTMIEERKFRVYEDLERRCEKK